MNKLPPFNQFAPDLSRDPYPTYREYRTVEPIHHATDNGDDANNWWCLFRHADITALLRGAIHLAA